MNVELTMPATLPELGVQPVNPNARPKEAQGKVSMASINFWLDAGLFVNLIFIMWVSAVLQFVFPAPTESARWSLWGLTYNEWRNIQFASLCLFALLAVEHLVLHWNWVCSIVATRVLRTRNRPDEGEQAVYGVGTFIAVLVLVMVSVLAAMATVVQPVR